MGLTLCRLLHLYNSVFAALWFQVYLAFIRLAHLYSAHLQCSAGREVYSPIRIDLLLITDATPVEL